MAFQQLPIFIRNYDVKNHCIVLLPSVVMLGIVVFFVGTGLDVPRFFTAYRELHPTVTFWLRLVTDYANPFFYFVYAYFVYLGFIRQDIRLIILALSYIVAQLAISFLLVRLVKCVLGKPRPMAMLANEGYTPFTASSSHHSFPSGHTTEIVGAVLPLAYNAKRYAVMLAFGCIIALVGFSRIYLSMHHIADIVGGLFFGSLVGLIIQYLCTWKKYE